MTLTIILRLPDFSDRELVGKASGLTDKQIIELAKLEKGVAAISQSDWLEPVLCKIDRYEGDEAFFYDLRVDNDSSESVNSKIVEKSLLDCIMQKEIYRKGDRIDIKKLKADVLKSKLETSIKCDFLEYISAEKENAVKALRHLVYEFFNAESAIAQSQRCDNIVDWVHTVAENITPTLKNYSKRQIDLVMALLIYEQSARDASYNDILCRFTELYKAEGGVY